MRRQGGFALIEAVLLGLVLMVPLIWLLGVLSEVHKGAFAATSAAREAAIDAARAGDLAGATKAVDAAVARAFLDHGLDPRAARVRFSAAQGFARGATIEVVVRFPVRALGFPFIGSLPGPALWLDARNATRIEPYVSRR